MTESGNTMPMITKLMEKIGDHEIVGGYYVGSVDPATAKSPDDVKITRLYGCKPVFGFGNSVIYNFNFNDPKIIKMLEKKEDDTRNQESI